LDGQEKKNQALTHVASCYSQLACLKNGKLSWQLGGQSPFLGGEGARALPIPCLAPLPILTSHRGVLSPEQSKWIGPYCSPDLPDFVRLVEEGDERLFKRINNNSSHVLRELLTPPSMATQQYNLRRRPHGTRQTMPDHAGHLADKNFLIRMLFKDS